MDDINKTEAGNEETGRRENNSWIKRNFNYECYMTFLNGCYSCKWEAQQKKKPRRPLCCCSLRERLFYPWLIMSFFLSVILLFTWVETSNEYNGFDWVVFLGTRIWFFWSIVLLSVLGILAAYTTMLVVLGFLLCWEKNELYLHWYHKIMVLIVIMLCSFLMWILLTFWRERWLTIGLSLKLGPENTIMSFEKAVEHGADGLESDVQISLDEVPFLMHDYDLRRTTNILEVMPNASDKHSSFFYWNFLSTLNAGKWFADSRIKPFFNMKPLSKADRERARNQKIPKLSELLEIARKANKLVIFDLNSPPRSHPARSSYIRLVVRVILDSKIEQHLIIWLPGSDRDYVRRKAPGFQHIGRLFTIEQLTKEKITRINVDYKNLFHNGLKEYKAANITINVYLVNEPWLFSLVWCSSIHSVTTDNLEVLKQINHPYYFMTPNFYMFMWIFLDILSAVFIVAIFYSIWLRESQSEKILQGITSYTETPSVRSLHEEVLRVEETPGV
ncbi:glycerophosphodiester phosphodiesterase domain-containing protein 4 isoform X4 [Odocoileus virginianus]|uniref:Glycerophosphodiester phosphodiesterase domain-containing protein 4 isoform X4 n=1 Tax=Odocoileus virginianus TaxID=9874 RepID=A0ABM4IMK9_ODOVR